MKRRRPAADHGFIRPNYNGGSFADIPSLVQDLLTGVATSALQPVGWQPGSRRFQRVVTLFVDAFGWRFFERFQDHPLLRRFANAGSVTKITSQFPSTTSAHVTTLYTGVPVGQHGVYEWFYYEPQVDAMIAPLLFSFAGEEQRETLVNQGVEGPSILPFGQVSRTLAAQGVRSYLVQPRDFFNSTYTKQMGDSARMIPYLTMPEGLATMTQTLRNVKEPMWLIGYFGMFDAVCHIHGPERPQSDADLEATLDILERWVTRDVLGKFSDTLLMIIADHIHFMGTNPLMGPTTARSRPTRTPCSISTRRPASTICARCCAPIAAASFWRRPALAATFLYMPTTRISTKRRPCSPKSSANAAKCAALPQ